MIEVVHDVLHAVAFLANEILTWNFDVVELDE